MLYLLLRQALALVGSPSQPAPLVLQWQMVCTRSWWTRTIQAVAGLLKILLLTSSAVQECWVGEFPPSCDFTENTLECYKLQGKHLWLGPNFGILGQFSPWPHWAGEVRPDPTDLRWINSTSTLHGAVCKLHKHCRVKPKRATPQMLDYLQCVNMAATNSPNYSTFIKHPGQNPVLLSCCVV